MASRPRFEFLWGFAELHVGTLNMYSSTLVLYLVVPMYPKVVRCRCVHHVMG